MTKNLIILTNKPISLSLEFLRPTLKGKIPYLLPTLMNKSKNLNSHSVSKTNPNSFPTAKVLTVPIVSILQTNFKVSVTKKEIFKKSCDKCKTLTLSNQNQY